MYPEGLNQGATDEDLSMSFEPSPNYARLAEAAAGQSGWTKSTQAATVGQMRRGLAEAVIDVQSGRGAFVEALIGK